MMLKEHIIMLNDTDCPPCQRGDYLVILLHLYFLGDTEALL